MGKKIPWKKSSKSSAYITSEFNCWGFWLWITYEGTGVPQLSLYIKASKCRPRKKFLTIRFPPVCFRQRSFEKRHKEKVVSCFTSLYFCCSYAYCSTVNAHFFATFNFERKHTDTFFTGPTPLLKRTDKTVSLKTTTTNKQTEMKRFTICENIFAKCAKKTTKTFSVGLVSSTTCKEHPLSLLSLPSCFTDTSIHNLKSN